MEEIRTSPCDSTPVRAAREYLWFSASLLVLLFLSILKNQV